MPLATGSYANFRKKGTGLLIRVLHDIADKRVSGNAWNLREEFGPSLEFPEGKTICIFFVIFAVVGFTFLPCREFFRQELSASFFLVSLFPKCESCFHFWVKMRLKIFPRRNLYLEFSDARDIGFFGGKCREDRRFAINLWFVRGRGIGRAIFGFNFWSV